MSEQQQQQQLLHTITHDDQERVLDTTLNRSLAVVYSKKLKSDEENQEAQMREFQTFNSTYDLYLGRLRGPELEDHLKTGGVMVSMLDLRYK